jgi:hypothetical protein
MLYFTTIWEDGRRALPSEAIVQGLDRPGGGAMNPMHGYVLACCQRIERLRVLFEGRIVIRIHDTGSGRPRLQLNVRVKVAAEAQ